MFFAMIRLIVLFTLSVTTPVFGLWDKSLKVRFDVNPFGIGTTSFMEMPQSTSAAEGRGWEVVMKPTLPSGYDVLVLMCPENDYTLCMLYDDTGYIAGLQIAFDSSKYSSYYDIDSQGFTEWVIDVNGKNKKFYTTQQYYISPETLNTETASRIASRDSKRLLQDGNIFVTGFNGDLYNISTRVKDFTKNSIYTKQACIPWMGIHYYYNMSSSLPCQADTMFPWFPLVYSNQLIGVGFVVFGKYTVDSGSRNYFENPGRLAAQLIVPRGPDCLYKLADSPGLVTMHTYFIKNPQLITCL
ncbi:uncharacterized protein LOC142981233 isoform X2 [Anticarsia gemmatalis]|uniref:uncharacterized protein LOC142981233 isoform X2 n=1 Tax=Anticarsia gemmatalis TaxID=129554 RepID=UPI003F76B08F